MLTEPDQIYDIQLYKSFSSKGRHGHNRMVVGFTTTCVISSYHHYSKVVGSNSAHEEVY